HDALPIYRIGERDTHLDGICAGGHLGKEVDEALRRRESRGQVGDEEPAPTGPRLVEAALQLRRLGGGWPGTHLPGEAGDHCGDHCGDHRFIARATISTSLSPRPERLTSTLWPRPSSRARSFARARACEDSSAGMMPSVRDRRLNASRASASLAAR